MTGEDAQRNDGKITIGTRVTREFAEFLDRLIGTSNGMYKDRSDFIRDALREKVQNSRAQLNQNPDDLTEAG